MTDTPSASILATLLRTPPRARAALLISALHAIAHPHLREAVQQVRDRSPRSAGPQLMQQIILDGMGHGLVDTQSATEALIPAADHIRGAIAEHLGDGADAPLEPYAIELWGLIEALFPEPMGQGATPGHS